MKLVKMSLAAALLVSGAYALDNVKVNGSAKLIYQTTDRELTTAQSAAKQDTGMFERGALGQATAAAGGAQVLLGATADLVENISAGAEVQVFSTLGLENNLVSNVMATGNTADQWNMSQLWMAGSLGKSTVKVGRMELDTPMLFTEKWNVAKNTFEAAVIINSDIENTTLVGAYVGKHNGTSGGQTAVLDKNTTDGGSDSFSRLFGGAYAVGVINTSIENTTLQAWYYNVNGDAQGLNGQQGYSTAVQTTLGATIDNIQAFWLQADIKNIADLVNIGVQYANIDVEADVAAGTVLTNDNDVWAVKVAGTVSDVNVFAAYSTVSDNPVGSTGLGFQNFSTGDKTKIYTGTGSIYMDGIVTTPDTNAWKIGASAKVADYALAANYTSANNGGNNNVNTVTNSYDWDVSGWDLSVGTKLGALDLKAIYTDISNEGANSTFVGNNSTPYAGTDIQTLRVIASVKF